jgi:hypothetical protein
MEPDVWALSLNEPASIKSRMCTQLETTIVKVARPVSQSE